MHLSLTQELCHSFKAPYQTLCAYDPNEIVTQELMVPIVSYLNQFWLWASINIPHDRWITGDRVRPILGLQNSLTKAEDK